LAKQDQNAANSSSCALSQMLHYHPEEEQDTQSNLGQEATSPPPVVDPIIAAIHDCSTIFARWRNCACQYNT